MGKIFFYFFIFFLFILSFHTHSQPSNIKINSDGYLLQSNKLISKGCCFNPLALFNRYQNFLRICKNAPNQIEKYALIGEVLFEQKKYDQAIALLEYTSFLSVKKYGILNPINESCLKFKGFCYRIKKEKGKEFSNLMSALQINRQIYKTDNAEKSLLLYSIAEYYTDAGNHSIAFKYYSEAVKTLENTENASKADLAFVYLNIANSYGKTGLFNKQLEYFQKALQIKVTIYGGDHLEVASMFSYIAQSYKERGQYLNAFNYYLKSLNSMGPIAKYPKSYSVTELELAYSIYEKTINLIEKIRTDFKNIGSKVLLARYMYPVFENAIRTTYCLYTETGNNIYIDKAFNLMEKNRNLLIVEALRDSKAKNIGGIPDGLAKQERELSSQIIINKEYLDNERAKPLEKQDTLRISYFEAKGYKLQQQVDSLGYFMEQIYPKYFNLEHRTDFATIEKVRTKVLNNEHALIEYFYGDSSIFIITITKANTAFIEIKNDEEIQNTINTFQNAIRVNDYQKFVESSYSIYEKFFKPVEKFIDSKKKLIIVPSKYLNYIPFECIINSLPNKETNNFKELNYLIKKYDFSYSPSSTLLLENTDKPAKLSNPNVLALAPVFDWKQKNEYKTIHPKVLDSTYINLPEQRYAIKLLDVIKNDLPGKFLIGKQAVSSAFRNEAEKYNIIHLATHSIIDQEQPMNSRIVFSKEIVNNKLVNSGYFYAYDLYSLQLNASMVVLGSCETGMGQLKKGEGLMSIAHGFRYAGCPSLVYSLWEVDEKETNLLMEYFYDELLKGTPKDEALHKAKLRYLNESNELTANPFFWASFIISGDTTPFEFSTSHNDKKWVIILFAGIIIVGLILFLFRKRISKR